MKPLCGCGCGKTPRRYRNNNTARGTVKGEYKKYASAECYRKHRREQRMDVCHRGHPKQERRNGERVCWTCVRASGRVRRYGVSWDVALAIPPECEICGEEETDEPHGRLVLDHNHDTEEFRGWLCQRCNALLGMAEDNVLILKLAIRYLKERS
jgi:hypothetical protein